MSRILESSVWVRKKSVRASQSAVVRPDLLPRANDTTAWLHLYRWRDQEFGPSFHAIKAFFFKLHTLSNSQNQNLLRSCCIIKQIKLGWYSQFSVYRLFVVFTSNSQRPCLHSKHMLRGRVNTHILFAHLCCIEYTQSPYHLLWNCNTDQVVACIKLSAGFLQEFLFFFFLKSNSQNRWCRVGLSVIH